MKTTINGYLNSIRDLDRENRIYPNNILVKDEFEKCMKDLVSGVGVGYDENIDIKMRYDMVWDILEYMTIYNEKIGTKGIKLTNIQYLITKNQYNLTQIRHKWKKLSENPKIDVKDIWIDYKS